MQYFVLFFGFVHAFARIYFCVDILKHCRISLLSIVAEKKNWRPFFRRLNVVVYILEIYLVTDEIYLKSIIIGSRLDYSFNIFADAGAAPWDSLQGVSASPPRFALLCSPSLRVVATSVARCRRHEQPTKSACPRFRACSPCGAWGWGRFPCYHLWWSWLRSNLASRPCYARRLNFHVRSTGAHSENSNNFADYIVDAILRFIFRIRTCFARIYFCVDILEHCRISLSLS